ncbi:unnamed protein product [Protopolystoma xenopodis]|uniref:Choline transporter-like protein n=1 Tax=Protopolystoma xenopodis TaxID=117903 RepID=A0A448WH85_9PLAT|nr:unnamed protein product [Protopolystoma xenopodis]
MVQRQDPKRADDEGDKEVENRYRHSPYSSLAGDEKHPENRRREHDVNFKGPIKNRSCTDIICLIIFLLFICGHCFVAYFAFSKGDPRILMKPADSQGRLCGEGILVNKTKLFFFDLLSCARMGPAVVFTGCPTPQVCVSTCPTTNWVFLTLAAEERLPGVKPDAEKRADQLICIDSFDARANLSTSIDQLVQSDTCAAYYVASGDLFNRCLPRFLLDGIRETGLLIDETGRQLIDASGKNVTAQDTAKGNVALLAFLTVANHATLVVADLVASWYWILTCILIGAVAAFIYCLLLRFFVGFVIWLTLVLFFIFFAGSTTYCFVEYFLFANTTADGRFIISTQLSTYLSLKEFWLGLAIVGCILTGIVLIILIFLRTRISLAVAILGEASKVIMAIPTAMIYPIFPFLLELGVIALWLAITVYLAATGHRMFSKIQIPSTNALFAESVIQAGPPTVDWLPQNASVKDCGMDLSNPEALGCQFVKYGGNAWSFYLQAYNLFMAFWLFVFLSGLSQMVLAGAIASWYWAWEKPKDVPVFPVLISFLRTCRYHLGTVAFGSLLIAIVMLIRALIAMLRRQLAGKTNCPARFVLCICACCFWCLDKVLRFITKNAYIVTAILGKSFCPAAANAFFLILRNCLRLLVVDSVTGFFLFIGKLVVTVGAGTLAYFFFNGTIQFADLRTNSLNYFYVPIIVVIVGTFAVASLFFSVFSFTVDVLFICVMEDLERNDGTENKPYFMSKQLMKVLSKKNKFKDDPDRREDPCGCCCCMGC